MLMVVHVDMCVSTGDGMDIDGLRAGELIKNLTERNNGRPNEIWRT